MTPTRFEVDIDELVLHGFPASGRHRIADAFAAELTRLLETRGLPATATPTDRLDGGTITATGRPEETGRRIARAVHAALLESR